MNIRKMSAIGVRFLAPARRGGSMRRGLGILLGAAMALGALGGMRMADAHECGDVNDPSTCEDTAVAPNWRDGYVPLFGLADRDDDQERREAQRWRDEYGCDAQHCVWVKQNSSVDGGAPTAVHAGTAADHSMFEVAHQSEDHREGTESNHDAHGGAIYADVCASSEEDTSYEGQAGACQDPSDTQVGVTLVDHNPCSTVLPYVSCTDEYHVVRPLDTDYTQQQLQNTASDTQAIADDPRGYLCGHHYPDGDDCVVPAP
jgi:hypothetical protein